MPPWLRVLDTVLGLADLAARKLNARTGADGGRRDDVLATGPIGGGLEARLAGVVVAALKEAFDRNHQRLDLERQRLDAERQRADRALRLELLRQAGEREIGRLRLLAGVALAGWLGTMFFSSRLLSNGLNARVLFAVGWLFLLGSLAASFIGQSRVASDLVNKGQSGQDTVSAGIAGQLAAWLTVGGLAVIACAVLFG